MFDGIFITLQTGLSKLGDNTGSQTKAVRDLIHLIQTIPMSTRQDYDVLGYIYEDLISKFASNAGKKAGEFYTPHEVSVLMADIVAHHLRGRDNLRIYDPTSGSGSLLITIGDAVKRRMGDADGIAYYAQELNQSTYNLTRMNLVMRGIKPSNITVRNGDTLEDDWPYFDDSDPSGTYDPLYVDAVVSNPPYSQRWEPEGKENDIRFAYGIAPRSKADYAFLLHDLYHLKPSGIMCIVLPHGVLFRGGEEGTIRRNLIENDKIAAIIGLPANIFFGTGIPAIIMVLRQKRDESDVLIIDASKDFEKVGKNNQLRSSDIRRIVDTVTARRTVEGYSRLVEKDEIRANDYNLNIPRYVDSSEPAETWDLYASMFGGIPIQEIDALGQYWEALPGLREELFAADNAHCARSRCEEVAAAVRDLYHLKPSGIMCIVLPHGVLFRGGEEGTIRRNLIENDKIAAIIGLPANIFFGTGIPAIIMVLRQKRDESDVLIIDASKDFEKVGKNNQLRSSDIRRIVDTVTARRTVEGYSRLVEKDEIRANDYNLNIPRYVDSSEPAETWDLYASMFGGIPIQEIDALGQYWEALPGLREELFAADNAHCARSRCEEVAAAVRENGSVCDYIARYQTAFSGLRRQLVSTLIGGWERVDASSAEASVADEVFRLVEPFSLVDKYDAYQALDNAWGVIAADLEMLQTEGFNAARKVDPKYVLKKKSGKDVEVQDGWKGHILPFSLVQDALLSVEAGQLRDLQDEMSRLNGECESLKEELPHEDAEEGDADESCDLTDAEIAAKQAELASLQKKLKGLKKEAKAQESALEEKTREAIESLTDEQVYELLEAKWVAPLMDDLNALPQASVECLIKKVNALEEKYKDTYADVAERISEAERELDAMLGQLVGDEFDMLGIAELRKLLGGE